MYSKRSDSSLSKSSYMIVSIVVDELFWDLDGPAVRITTPHIPLPAADNLEDIAIPSVDRIYNKIFDVLK